MANPDFPMGFEPLRKTDGTTLLLTSMKLAATHDAIGKRDALELRADGFVHRAQATSRTIIGVAAESKGTNAGGTILAYPVLNTLFVAQVDDANVAAQTDINLNYDIVVTAPSSSGESRMEIDGSTKATTATLPVKVLGLYEKIPATNEFGEFAKVLCMFNETAFGAGSLGI